MVKAAMLYKRLIIAMQFKNTIQYRSIVQLYSYVVFRINCSRFIFIEIVCIHLSCDIPVSKMIYFNQEELILSYHNLLNYDQRENNDWRNQCLSTGPMIILR